MDLSLDQLKMVVGTGPVGLRAVALGVTPIVAIDLSQPRLDLVKKSSTEYMLQVRPRRKCCEKFELSGGG